MHSLRAVQTISTASVIIDIQHTRNILITSFTWRQDGEVGHALRGLGGRLAGGRSSQKANWNARKFQEV